MTQSSEALSRKKALPSQELLASALVHSQYHSDSDMKLYYLLVIFAPPAGNSAILSSASDLSSFSFYQRGSVGEFMEFLSKTVAERTPAAQRQTVKENNYTAHVYNQGGANHLAAVAITDDEYPVRPVSSLLLKILDEFSSTVPSSCFANPSSISFEELKGYLTAYQDPREIDPIMRVQQELDETKIVIHKAIESVLKRGENLDRMVEQTNALSASSKSFYRIAKKQNSCCVVV